MSEIAASLREAVQFRARFRCEYCHLPMNGQIATFPVDHIISRIFGGVTELTNLALACPQCNANEQRRDGNHTPTLGAIGIGKRIIDEVGRTSVA